MNRRMVLHILGQVLIVEAILMLPALLVGILYKEFETLPYFLIPMGILLAVGFLLRWKKPADTAIYSRDGLFIVAAAWVFMSLAGAIPFHLCGQFPTFADAFFEIVSGFTTTGASVIAKPELLPHSILLWRSFSHWIGGMGVLVFILAVLPLSEDRSLHLMRAEAPGPMVDKLVPKMRDTAKILYGVYAAMTLLLFILLVCGGMPVFDAVCNSFATAGTGGFSIHSSGIGLYNSAYIDIVLAVFMLLFGVNFNLYYLILLGRWKAAIKSEEVHWYFGIVAFATVTIAANIYRIHQAVGGSLRYAFFQVSSIITTTGFATEDFNLYPEYSRHLLALLMIIGACAGSTGGGLKVSRLILLGKTFTQEIRKLFHPRAVSVVRLDGKALDDKVIRGTLTYFGMYTTILLLSILTISIDNFDFTTNVTAVLSCFNNIGPGLGVVGPVGTFGLYSGWVKVFLSFVMLLGRLEILPMLILFAPGTWSKKYR